MNITEPADARGKVLDTAKPVKPKQVLYKTWRDREKEGQDLMERCHTFPSWWLDCSYFLSPGTKSKWMLQEFLESPAPIFVLPFFHSPKSSLKICQCHWHLSVLRDARWCLSCTGTTKEGSSCTKVSCLCCFFLPLSPVLNFHGLGKPWILNYHLCM